jgi:hypothetical protein
MKTRVLALRGRMRKDGRQATVTYDLSGKSPWAVEDFVGEGAAIGDRGLSWSTTKRLANGNTEADIPTLRWKEGLLPPVNLSWQVVLHPNTHLVLLGVAAGERRVRIGFSNFKSFNHQVLALATKDDGLSCEPVPKSVKGRLVFPAGEVIRVEMAITADSRLSIKYNDQVVAENIVLPTGKPITPIIQGVLLTDSKPELTAAVDIPMLSISGILPEGK